MPFLRPQPLKRAQMDQDKTVSAKLRTKPDKSLEIPVVDPNSPLKIDEAISNPDIPQSDINAPLKIETDSGADITLNQGKSGKNLFVLGSLIGLVIIVSAIGFYFYLAKNNQGKSKDLQPSQPRIEEKPQQQFTRSDWSLEILNGSGTVGVAKKAAEELQLLGYKILSTGNADKSNYQGVLVFVSENRKGEAQDFIVDLSSKYKSASFSATLKDSTASARVIIGEE